MKSHLTTHLLVALNALIIAVLITGAAWYVSDAQKSTEQMLSDRLARTEKRIIELAEVTDRNGADTLTEEILRDCDRRTEFEAFLNGLGTASRRDLITTQQLFESCGAYFSERKALMVAQLGREYQALEDDIVLLGTIRDLTPREAALRKWKEVVVLEQKRSDLLNEQTVLQKDIIQLLIEGDRGNGVAERVQTAQNIAELLSVTDAQVDTARTSLVK